MAAVAAAATLAGCVEAPAARSAPEPPASTGGEPAYATLRACIRATAGGTEFTVIGTAMVPAPPPPSILVLLPGADSPRHIFDLGNGDASMQRYLAARGVATFAMDRPGMGESTYAGSALTFEATLDVVDQVVRSVRSGAWAAGPGCEVPGASFPKVLVGGHSLGGILSVHHAASNRGVDGIVPMGTPFTGVNKATLLMVLYCWATTSDPPFVGPGGNAVCNEAPAAMPTCEGAAAYPPTADVAATRAFCTAARAQPDSLSPAQILTGFATLDARVLEVRVPVHVVFYAKDWFLYDEGFEQENIRNALELWARCGGCAVSSTVVPDTGHLFPVHAGQEVGYQAVVDWMVRLGFVPGGPA